MKKFIPIALLSLGLTLMGSAAGFAEEPAPEEDGGTRDTSVRHEEPVVIKSEDIKSFRLKFEFSADFDEETMRERYPGGLYELCLEQAGEGAHCHLGWTDQTGKTLETDFAADAEALTRLDALLKEHDVAQIDGHAMQNTALGDFMDLEVLYESGEKISARGEGGGVKPDPRYYREEWFIDFFRGLAREYDEDVLAPLLTECTYRVSGGSTGYSFALELRRDEDGDPILHVSSQQQNGAEKKHRTYKVDEATVKALANLVAGFDLPVWDKLPAREEQALDADIHSLGVAYSNGVSLWIDDTQALPSEAFDAMHEVRAFLEELDVKKPAS